MSEITTEADLIESLDELRYLVQEKLDKARSESKLIALEDKIRLLTEKNKTVSAILDKVMAELENLSNCEDITCQQ